MSRFRVFQFNMQFGQMWNDIYPDRAPVRLEATLEEIRRHEADIILLRDKVSEANQRGGLWRPFQTGEQVQVTMGRTHSLARIVECSNSPKARVKVLLEFLGRLVHAEVPLEAVQLLDARLAAMSKAGLRAPRRTRGKGRWIQGFGARVSPH